MIVMDGVEMVDVQEAAHLAQRTPETIRRWVWSGRLEARKSGQKLFVRRADVTSVEDGSASRAHHSLASWIDRLPVGAGKRGASAADLVLEDRERRAGR